MFSQILRLLTQPVYIDPRIRNDQPPDYLTLNELANLPSWHPCRERQVEDKARPRC